MQKILALFVTLRGLLKLCNPITETEIVKYYMNTGKKVQVKCLVLFHY